MIAKVKACLQVEVEYSLFLAAYFAILEHQSKIESLFIDGYSVIDSLRRYLIFFIIVLESRAQLMCYNRCMNDLLLNELNLQLD